MCANIAKEEYGENVCGAQEKERPRRLLDAVYRPRGLHGAEEDHHPERREPPDAPHVKEEEQEAEITAFTFTGVATKSEDDGERGRDAREDDLRLEQQEPPRAHVKEDELEDVPTQFPLTVIVKSEDSDEDHYGGFHSESLSVGDHSVGRYPDTDFGDEHSKDVREDLHPERRQPESVHIKEKDEDEHPYIVVEVQPDLPHLKDEDEQETKTVHIKEEDQEFLSIKEEEGHHLIKFPVTFVPRKSKEDEDKGQSDESRRAEHPTSSPRSDSVLAPLSDSDDMTSHSHDRDDDDYVKREMSSHTDNARRECSLCGKTFTSKGGLRLHMRIHTGEKPFPCEVCGKRFTAKRDLKTHTRTHTGEKPFACSVCEQRFSLKANLTRHTRTHTGEKPFGCSVCDRRFSSMHHVKRHKCLVENSSFR
ncbi:zinc finger protein 90-like isoform X2 [Syngnathoides biaculeatus]|uniref:zinc finger protein 90-like isoform X2 n=1 Tax=Syngnathoides biaculeatus TaxID=300417 RepID=UPI002ADE7398|nr:zinc finger protein 90-like isoform X2 [Syngnathoides biaculeatus]